jgi:hypothetical protein
MQLSEIGRSAFGVGRWAFAVDNLALPRIESGGIRAVTKQKNVTIKGLPCPASLLHLVCPHGQPRYYLLLTAVHRFLAPLFTSIPTLLGKPQPLSYRHDSTQTRNSARFTK